MAAHVLLLPASLLLFFLFAAAGAAVAPRTVRGQTITARIAIGFALVPVLCIVPLYVATSFVPTFLLLFALAAYGTRRMRFSVPRTTAEKAFWFAAIANLLLLAYGTVAHPGMGDHDPYEHAMGTSYLFETGRLFTEGDVWRDLATLDPYPPGYDAASAALSRLSGSVAFGLRLWGLACAAMFPFALRFFARSAGLSEKWAALAGAVSVLLPPAPTHFAWTHTMGLSLTLVTGGALALSLQHRKWVLVGGIGLAALGLSASSDVVYSAVILVPVIWHAARERKVARPALALAIALAVAAPWIFHAGKRIAEAGSLKTTRHFAAIRGHFDQPPPSPRPWYKEHRGNARPYGTDEFLLPHWKNYFNIPVGLPAGAFLPALAGCALWWRRKQALWLAGGMALMLVAVQGERLPAEFFPHRAWSYLAVFTAIGFAVFVRYLPAPPRRGIAALAIALCAVSLAHSAAVRVRLESRQWGNEVFLNEAQREGYYALLKTVRGEKTWPFTGGIRFGHVAAFGGRATFWEERERKADALVEQGNYQEAINLLLDAGYRYFVIDATVDLRLGQGAGRAIFRAAAGRGDLRPLAVADGYALFAVTDNINRNDSR